ncbi:PepSY domain-containing protein [Clostridioides mangenotii]|uniref:PepSY domain-containing protein n=1 Tax=Metaclostridioides mangenotii TaxID=1540 RepID=UPI002149E071|nr:PepSY domain-containing protein [Clostridioides mangenotii]MCR1955951.1 PepSY domain-containing protein [Clostridioides mangenotii]
MKRILGLFLLGIIFITGCQKIEKNFHSATSNNKADSVVIKDNRQSDAESKTTIKKSKNESINNVRDITLDQAKKIAQKKVDGKILVAYESNDDGIRYYEIEVVDGDKKYEFEISTEGNIIQMDKETYISVDKSISIDEAKQKLLDYVGGGTIVSSELADGNGYYEIKLIKANKEYDAKVNAISGEILQFSVED